jgi:hypothetical protein
MHAKAWLLHRPSLSGASPSSTAYIGSSNLFIADLHEGLEWNVRLSAHYNEGMLAKLQAAFESYWEEDAFEFYRACTPPPRPVRAAPACLFLAHRKEILQQSLTTFRQVLRVGFFGELRLDGHGLSQWRHLFASVQSLAELDRAAHALDTFTVVIVGESHAVAAASSKRRKQYLNPIRLLGLKA